MLKKRAIRNSPYILGPYSSLIWVNKCLTWVSHLYPIPQDDADAPSSLWVHWWVEPVKPLRWCLGSTQKEQWKNVLWLVVSTHLKNISQIENHPQVEKYLKPPATVILFTVKGIFFSTAMNQRPRYERHFRTRGFRMVALLLFLAGFGGATRMANWYWKKCLAPNYCCCNTWFHWVPNSTGMSCRYLVTEL